jgi:NADH/NAD ratio-sensing transcriptional regulator Rex
MDEQIRARRERRMELLRRLYHRVDGSVSEFVSAPEIGHELGVDAAETRRILEYWEEKGLLKVDDHRDGIVRITAAGIDEVETHLLA